jgi:hypothetical protein
MAEIIISAEGMCVFFHACRWAAVFILPSPTALRNFSAVVIIIVWLLQ